MFLRNVLGLDLEPKQKECGSTGPRLKAGARKSRQDSGRDGSCRPSHSGAVCHVSRSGQPAETHARTSSGRQKTARPIRMGRGMRHEQSHERQVRVEMPQIAATSGARRRSGSATLTTGVAASATSVECSVAGSIGLLVMRIPRVERKRLSLSITWPSAGRSIRFRCKKTRHCSQGPRKAHQGKKREVSAFRTVEG